MVVVTRCADHVNVCNFKMGCLIDAKRGQDSFSHGKRSLVARPKRREYDANAPLVSRWLALRFFLPNECPPMLTRPQFVTSFPVWLCLAGGLLLTLADSALAGTPSGLVWPQFRGPTQQGHAEASAKPPIVFNENEHLVYKTPIPGVGWSSPVVADNEVWLTTALLEEKKLQAICLDYTTGKIIHAVTVFEPEEWEEIHLQNSQASPTPVIDEKNVYVHFGNYGNAAIDRMTGKIVWKNNEIVVNYMTGAGSHPIPFENSIIITCDGADKNIIAALDKSTGQVIWTQGRSQPLRNNADTHRSFSTPLIARNAGQTTPPEVMVSIGPDQVHGYDPRNGNDLWYATYQGFSTVPMPITDGESVYVATGFGKATFMAIKLGGQGDITNSHISWKNNKGISLIPSPLLVDGLIYMSTEKGTFLCIDPATGEQLFQERLGGNMSSSPIYAGGHIYLADENGVVYVIKPGREFKLVQKNELQSGQVKGSPAAVGNSLLLRSENGLYRFE